jgi:hypothetical protein
MPIVWKSESLNIQETCGAVQTCTGIALPLLFFLLLVHWSNLNNFYATAFSASRRTEMDDSGTQKKKTSLADLFFILFLSFSTLIVY